MAYDAEISRDHPTCFVFVVDQSGSMDEKLSEGPSKATFVSDVLNKTLATLVARCSKADGIRNYFDIGVVAYGGQGVNNGLKGPLASSDISPITAIESSPASIETRLKKVSDGAGGLVDQSTKFPVWFTPTSSGATPMCAALTRAAEIVGGWCDSHANSYPPTILHITDGQSTDGNPESICNNIRQLSTLNGEVLLFNLNISASGGQQIAFPSSESILPDEYARLLFRMSSTLPQHVCGIAQGKGYSVNSEARGMIFNGGAEMIVDFFDIGTRPRLVADR